MSISPADIQLVAALLQARAGLSLAADASYLLETRLGPVARKSGFNSVPDLIGNLRVRRDEALAWAVVEALADNETWFFRDAAVFSHLREAALPALARARPSGALRLWSAGCSTGQEAYALAMLAEELGPSFPDVAFEIVATDLSHRCLEKAQAGVYTQFEVQRGLPIRTLLQHFRKEEDNWRLAPRLRQAVRFRRVNLLEDTAALGAFDVVLCRNVLTSLTSQAAELVSERLVRQLSPDGVLVLGQTEPLPASVALAPAAACGGVFARPGARRAAA